VFDTMFKSGFMEGLKKSADLPEDEPETFEPLFNGCMMMGLMILRSTEKVRRVSCCWAE